MNIYKNLLRDMRMYFNDEFLGYQNNQRLQKKNKEITTAFFPVVMSKFTKTLADKKLVECFQQNVDESDNIRLYFIMSCFIQPKQVLNLFDIDSDDLVNKIRNDTRTNSQVLKTFDQYLDIDYESLSEEMNNESTA